MTQQTLVESCREAFAVLLYSVILQGPATYVGVLAMKFVAALHSHNATVRQDFHGNLWRTNM